MATEAKLAEKTISLQNGNEAKQASIAKSAFFEKVASMLNKKDSLVRACIDLERLPEYIGNGKRFGFPKKMNQLLASLLLGGILELGLHSSAALITLDTTADGFLLETRLDATPKALEQHHQVFFCHHPETGIKPLPKVPKMIGGFTWHRELGEWYRTRDQLLEDHVLPEFDKFEAGIGNILPGKDFGEDVMPLL
ncbi:hypothetical protein N9260_01090 [bacterium]|nr:hypothetical protein [bacterium]